MLCFEITINGERKGLIGCEGADEYGVYISNYPQLTQNICSISAEGAFPSDNVYSDELSWFKTSAKPGDVITVTVVHSTTPDKPTITKYQEGVVSDCNTPGLCSSCGTSQFETEKFVSGGKVSLCIECIGLFWDMIND